MKRSFSFSDINRLIDDYRKAEQRQREISEVGEYESEVRKAAVRYVDSEAMAMMEDIAVEELNRDKKGIRVKALRDHGYNNYADILTARDYDLSAVRGISEDTALEVSLSDGALRVHGSAYVMHLTRSGGTITINKLTAAQHAAQ